MSQLAIAPPAQVPAGTRWCEECGYSLRGLPADRPCPECGHLRRAEPKGEATPHRTWSRCVALGLLLFVTLDATSTVLIQPSPDAFGGTGPALNLPGPKLWAVPLLQRPIGNHPELPGVVGTRTALLGLLAFWLITTPAGLPRLEKDQPLRLATRWTSVVMFGLAFGLLLATQGLWPSQLPAYRLMLVAGVELPGTALLYVYLRKLSAHVPGQTRRRSFDLLVLLVPVTIGGGAALLALQWLHVSQAPNGPRPGDAVSLAWSGAYGVLTAVCGVAAAAAVGSLAVAFVAQAFPAVSRWPAAARRLWIRSTRDMALADPGATERLRRFAVAAGLILLLVTMVIGNEHVLWLDSRRGFGGNLPFVNYPGPKVWIAAIATARAYSYSGGYTYDVIVSRTVLMFLTALSVWLLTSRGTRATDGGMRAWVRWISIGAIGAGAGWIAALTRYHGYGYDPDSVSSSSSVIFCIMTVLFECPATVLLYVYLGGMARREGMPRLAMGFRVLGAVVVLFVAAGAAMFAFSRQYYASRTSSAVLALGAGYGAAGLLAAAWGSAALLALALTVLRNRPADLAAELDSERRRVTA